MTQSLTLIRIYEKEATRGETRDKNGNVITATLELKDLQNQRDNPATKENEASCIPEGIYLCRWTRSNSFSNKKFAKMLKAGQEINEERDAVWTYEVIGVPGRSGIRIHAANTVDQLFGCIAPATVVLDNDPKKEGATHPDKRWFASQSATALKKLEDLMQKKDFMLTVTSYKSQCSV